MKPCSKCGETKPFEDYYKHPRGVGGRRGDCKLCVLRARKLRYETDGEILRARVREYQAKNPVRYRSPKNKDRVRKYTRKRYLEQTYGITVDDYEEMFARQGGCCAVCGTEDPVRSWTVDHDHLTGAVRGVLCWHCNIGLGHFRDDIANLIAAADYLIRSAARQEAPVGS